MREAQATNPRILTTILNDYPAVLNHVELEIRNLDEEREAIKKARKDWYKSMAKGETVELFSVQLKRIDGRTSTVDGIRKAKKPGEYDLKVIVQIPSSGIFHNEIMEELSDADGGSRMSLCVFSEDKYYFMNFIE